MGRISRVRRQPSRDDVLSWPVMRYQDGSVTVEIPGYGVKRYTEAELATVCVEVLQKGDTEATVKQRLLLERLCGPVRWREVNLAVETADEYLRDLAALTAS